MAMAKPRMLPIVAPHQRCVDDPVTGQHWECRVEARRPTLDEDSDEGWVERVRCRHEGMEAELDLPLGELAYLPDGDLLDRIVGQIAS